MFVMTETELNRIKNNYPHGTRIELIFMDDQYSNLTTGDKGTVDYVDDAGQIHMKWDNGSSLALILGEDMFKKI